MSTNTKSVTIVNASHQYLSITNNLGIDGGAVTVAFWIKLSSNPVGAGSVFDICSLSSSGTHHIHHRMLYVENSGNYDLKFKRARANVNGTEIVKASANLGTSTWHHIAATYDTTNLNLYIDGALAAGPTAASGDGTSNNNHFAIGTGDDSEGASFTPNSDARKADAKYDDVRVYSADIGASAISNLFNSPSNVIGSETNLVAGYNFNSSVTADASSNAFNLTNTNTVVTSTDVPFVGSSATQAPFLLGM